ncbi:MAG: hypothetical protein KC421_11895 [Anaerolineales bacterium]|nr:hypothetical protein [Anaerolineales bacterium]
MIARYHNQTLIPFSPLPQSNGRSCAFDAAGRSQRQNRRGIVRNDANGSNKTNGQPTTRGRMYAPFVAMSLQNPNENTRHGIVAGDAKRQQPNGGGGQNNTQPCNDTVVPLNSRSYVVPPTVGNCRHCAEPLTRKSRNGRLPIYCSARCRVAAYRARQKNGGAS